MNKKLYVSNLSFSMNDSGLENVFSAAGAVTSARVIMDRQSGRSKGFGFVEMSTEEEASRAVEQFNGKEVDGRVIRVAEALPEEPRGQGGPRRSPGGFGGGNGGGGFSRNRAPR
jgi:cold-inducible RNA-binding protein